MILTVAFGKGGTGKTTTAAAILNAGRLKGLRTLAIDCDPQANLTFAMGGDPQAPGLYALMTDKTHAAHAIQKTQQGDLIASGLNLASAEQEISSKPGRDFILKAALQPIVKGYDLIVIDTPPDLNTLLINALAASDRVLLTMQADSFSLMGLYQIGETIKQVQRYCNPALTVAGVLLTRYNPRKVLSRDMRDNIKEQAEGMGFSVFDTHIRDSIAVSEAQAMQRCLFEYAPNNNATKDYQALIAEMEM